MAVESLRLPLAAFPALSISKDPGQSGSKELKLGSMKNFYDAYLLTRVSMKGGLNVRGAQIEN